MGGGALIISREDLHREADASGFRQEVLEKVIHLLSLLAGFRSHPFLKDRIVLKGGTALNLFIFDLPRLSVDIDLNYIGAADRETMLAERPKVEDSIRAVCSREGFNVRRVPGEHAGGKWSLRYASTLGRGGNLQVDLNFMFRIPLWPVAYLDSKPIGAFSAENVPVLDAHELAAGKLAALFARSASRDLFDAHRLLTRTTLEKERLRTAFVVYGAGSRTDWRTVSVESLEFDEIEFANRLLPMLRRDDLTEIGNPVEWTARLIEECKRALGVVLPLSENEKGFLDRLLDHGEIAPGFLTADAELAERIRQHPLLEWKAVNVRRHKGKET